MRPSAPLLLPALLLSLVPLTASASDYTETIVPDVVAQFDPAALSTPESIATDFWGNLYISQALTGEITRINAWGDVETLAVLPVGEPLQSCFGFVGGIGALTATPWGLYVNVNACDEANRGVWWVSPHTGAMAKVAALPTDGFANGIAHRFGQLYISDSFNGRIWQVSAFGGDAEVWVEDPLLDPVENPFTPIGANGVQFYDNELYVANSTTGNIVAFPMEWGETAGAARVHASLPTPCDDFAFDTFGTLFCATNVANTILAVYPDGESEVVVDQDELDGPSAAAFGRCHDRFTLYITNSSFPFYPNLGNPSVVSIELPVSGWPFR